ncbi:MAG: Tfp pilus assembly protein FimT/FimU, partial [Verrucomicrobium sp.]
MLTPWKTSSPDRTSRSAERGVLRVLSQAFTLVEMLAVLGVLTVLIAAAGPAMIGAVRGSALQQARNQIAATTALARQKAVTKHTMTALVVL